MATTHSSPKDGQYYELKVAQQYLEKPIAYIGNDDGEVFRGSYYEPTQISDEYRSWVALPSMYGRNIAPALSASSSNMGKRRWSLNGYDSEKRRRLVGGQMDQDTTTTTQTNESNDYSNNGLMHVPHHLHGFEAIGSFSDFSDTSSAWFGDGLLAGNFLTSSELDSNWDLCSLGGVSTRPSQSSQLCVTSNHPQSTYSSAFLDNETHCSGSELLLMDSGTKLNDIETDDVAASSSVNTGIHLESSSINVDDDEDVVITTANFDTNNFASNIDSNSCNTDSDANNPQIYANGDSFPQEDSHVHRPSLNEENLAELNDISGFLKQEKFRKVSESCATIRLFFSSLLTIQRESLSLLAREAENC